jgi:hypothetical protein
VIYLNASKDVARAQVLRKLQTLGIQPEDLVSEQGPVLVHTTVPEDAYVDAVSNAGLRSIGLPSSYPLDTRARPIPHDLCQPIGQKAWDSGEPGIACRSAAPAAPPIGEELAFFARRQLRVQKIQDYSDWFW